MRGTNLKSSLSYIMSIILEFGKNLAFLTSNVAHLKHLSETLKQGLVRVSSICELEVSYDLGISKTSHQLLGD